MSEIAAILGLVSEILQTAQAIEQRGGNAKAALTSARDRLRLSLAEVSPVPAQVDAELERRRNGTP